MKNTERKWKKSLSSETIKKKATQIKQKRTVQQILLIPTPYMIEKVAAKLDYRRFYESELDLELGELKGDGYTSTNAICPFHDDKNPSLSINLKSGFFNCFGCGRKGNVFKFYKERHRVDDHTTLSELTKYLRFGGDKDNNTEQQGYGNIEAAYDYLGQEGQVVIRVCRFDNKQFRQCKPDGDGDWIWNTRGVELVPYNLPELIEADTVFIVEGEKDADNLNDIGLTASCNPMGAGKWRESFNQYFEGKHIIILPDNDDEGRKHAEKVANSLYNTVRSVKVVGLPGLPKKGDVSDWLDAGNTMDQLLELTETASSWMPGTSLSAPESGQTLTFKSITELLSMDFEHLESVIDRGILPEGCGLIIAGESEAGKSLITTEWALHLSVGDDILNGQFPVPKSRKVIIFQSENPDQQVQNRLFKMLNGLDIINPPDKIFFVDPDFQYDLLNENCVQQMIKAIEDSGAEVFIIDPLSSFHSVNENDNSLMRSVLDKITFISRKTGTASIVLHHFGKPVEGRADSYRVRGASSIKDWCDTLITLTGKSHENKILRNISFEKLRFGEKIKPILLERNNETLVHSVAENDTVVMARQVRELLLDQFDGRVDKQGDLEEAICNRFRCSSRTARKAIKQAVDLRLVSKRKIGRANTISVDCDTGNGE